MNVIEDPLNNRQSISSVAKKAVGVYRQLKMGYISSSISLYARVNSYFMPTILSKANRRVLRDFHKYGFEGMTLTLLIMEPNSTSEQ
jgi:hypothetical protein